LQHFGLCRDVCGIGFGARRSPETFAQVLDVCEPVGGLVIAAVATLH
jgi:hypothetical protein